MLGYIAFLTILFHITKNTTTLIEHSVIASLIFLSILMNLVIITLKILKSCIFKAETKESVLEDGIIDSPPKYCVEEQPPTYEEAIKMETIL